MDVYEEFSKLSVDEQLESFRAKPTSSIDSLKQNGIIDRMELLCLKIQDDFCTNCERLEHIMGNTEAKFKVDKWERKNNGGGGVTTVFQDGKVFEKAGVGISVVHGKLTPAMQIQMRSRGHHLRPPNDGDSLPFHVVGVSCVTHPSNPHCPTVHFNYRYFTVETADGPEAWFGGGTDLTPSYIVEEDIIHFHQAQKDACDLSGPDVYAKFKKWADDYFVIAHRAEDGECRGVGGIFYDDMIGDFSTPGVPDYEAGLRHQIACASSVCKSYFPIIEKHMYKEFTEIEKEWQQIRRGRYVEFNLVYDRGTKFGFATPGARVEAIMMTMPLTARWEYMNYPEKGTPEYTALKIFEKPRDWIK